MPPERDTGRAAGSAFVELMAAVAIVGIALVVMMQQISISLRDTETSQDRVFAYQRALGIFAELQADIERGRIRAAGDLDAFDDRGERNPLLTTMRDELGQPLAADSEMSGNRKRGGVWEWTRTLVVEEVEQQNLMRYVRVQVRRHLPGGPSELMATVGGVLNVPPVPYPSVQGHDLYVIACAEAPSLWQSMPAARATIESAALELAAASPALELRLHWITRLGYGRDAVYAPYVNSSTPATAAAPHAYWYPGKLAEAPGVLYSAEFFSGRVRNEAGVRNDYDASTNPLPHAVADQWNHCLRLPQARALHAARVAAGLEHADEPPLQLLLEDLAADPRKFRNAIFLNLHGEGLPVPPLRNYSDPAKDPATRPGVRVVTHPARLRAARDPNGDGDHDDTQDVELRVYAWLAGPDAGPKVLNEPITLTIPGLKLDENVNGQNPARPTTLSVRRLVGGIDVENGSTTGEQRDYAGFDSPSGLPPRSPGEAFEMWYEAGWDATLGHTWLRLHNTPLVAPEFGSGGLPIAQRLYGLEYVPSPVVEGDFERDLASPSSGVPKNTARWRLRIPKAAFAPGFPGGRLDDTDTLVSVATRIGTDLTTGTPWPLPRQPWNLSVTWCWWASKSNAVPFTERFQFQGDPRHNPYVDLVAGGSSFPHGYNWCFDNLRRGLVDATWRWPVLDAVRLSDGDAGNVRADAPRLLQLWREALQHGGALFVQAGGPTGGRILLGNEVAAPAAAAGGAPAAVRVHGSWFDRGEPVAVDSTTPEASREPPDGVAFGDHELGCRGTAFRALPWLGELFPDAAAADYAATGNLATAAGFHRLPRSRNSGAAVPIGTDPRSPGGRRLGGLGAVTLCECGSALATLVQDLASPSASPLTPALQEFAAAAGIELPPSVTSAVPFVLPAPLLEPARHFPFTDSFPKSSAALLESHATLDPQRIAIGLVGLLSPDGRYRGFLDFVGVTPVDGAEHGTLARASLLSSLRSFHKAGEPAQPGRIPQLPLVEILAPSTEQVLRNPAGVVLQWSCRFLRFDGSKYTAAFPEGFRESELDLRYVWYVSADGGETWRHAENGQPAAPGTRPADELLLPDSMLGAESWRWATPPSSVPPGHYLLRVEAWNSARFPHCAYHQVGVNIER
jgi:hypothetical protein